MNSDGNTVVLDFAKQVLSDQEFNADATRRGISEFEGTRDPSPADRLRLEGLTLYYANRLEQAEPVLNALVAIEPSARNLIKLAQTKVRLSKFQEALDAVERTQGDGSQGVLAHQVRAAALIGLGRASEAQSAARAANDIQPSARSSALSYLAGSDPAALNEAVRLAPGLAGILAASADSGALPAEVPDDLQTIMQVEAV